MNIEDKLPKAEDVLREIFKEKRIRIFTTSEAIELMHEYARRLLDVVAEDVKEMLVKGDSAYLRTNQRILKFKEMLK